MRGGFLSGLLLLAVVSFLAFTGPGRDLVESGIEWLSDVGAPWAAERIEDIGDGGDEPTRPGCGDPEPPGGLKVSEREAIKKALKFWGVKKDVPCERIETELDRSEDMWTVSLPRKGGCVTNAAIHAWTGEALGGGGGCP